MYNFDAITDRRGTGALKWDFAKERGRPEGLLPLWVADMDFRLPDEIVDDLQAAVRHGIYGYTEPLAHYYAAVQDWFGTRHAFTPAKEEIFPSPGVVFSLAMCVKAFTQSGEGVLIQPPVYYPFFEVIRDNGRRIEENNLLCADGRYTIDFADFEERCAKPDVKLFLLCSPHNPVGRVWERWELERLHDIAAAHDVKVIADEIHCDFVFPPHVHTSYRRIDEKAIVCTAPTKTFNMAGLQISNCFVPDPLDRSLLKKATDAAGYSQLGTLGYVGCEAAYRKGVPWLEELKTYLSDNLSFIQAYLADTAPKIKVVQPEGTYLLWMDFNAFGLADRELCRIVQEKAHLWLDRGSMFGKAGNGYQRLNFACPRRILAQALEQLSGAFFDM
ncbi:MAG: pyridoxal phosphate-dependent aminotransferase [Oscillospiraceae bacterium]|jgi:cystathionine beta-lyase|nr:pyridoxal phosphate-dependent aminotransferase [Oscillospiraceae bacterium]